MRPIQSFLSTIAAVLSFIGLAGGVAAQASAEPGGLQIELNSATDVDGACRISFVLENQLGADLTETVFETVLFDADGAVERLTLFDMRDLPAGRERVRQFQIDGLACTGIQRILFNGAQTCKGEGLDTGACMDRLSLSSRIDIELLG